MQFNLLQPMLLIAWLLTSMQSPATTLITQLQIHPSLGGSPWDGPVSVSRTIHVGGAVIQVDLGPGEVDVSSDLVFAWVETAARSVSAYYGRFPVKSMRVLVQIAGGARGVRQGTTWGNVGGFPAFARMRIGQHTKPEDLQQDWTMTHELVHTAFPSMDDDHHWIEEGTATYVEPIARVETGQLEANSVWRDMVRDMPKGQPETGDEGLDRTHSWGRTYWGGAGFCLLADVTIRQRTKNQFGLRDALRGVVTAGGTIDQDWPLSRALESGDAATGTHVLMELYEKMRISPTPVDLSGLWKELGIDIVDGSVHVDSHAPLADIRNSIMKTEAKSSSTAH
jgi:hypothetical protein